MIRTLIIDDEQLNIDLIMVVVQKYCPELDVVATACTVDEGLERIVQHNPELLILDIEIQEQTAFDLLQIVQDRKLFVILVTAYDKYAIKGIKHGVVDYLLKPLQAGDLIQSIQRVKQRMGKATQESSQIPPLEPTSNFISIASKEDITLLKKEEIIHLEAKGNYTEITTKTHKKITSSKLLKEYEILLLDPSFVRVHHSHIININCVTKYYRTKNGSIQLSNNVMIPISASKKKEVIELLGLKS